MYRKPVLLTSNLPIWKFVSNDREPLLNRMYSHMHLATSTVIKKFTSKGVTSTTVWKTAFENIQDVETFFQIPKNEHFMHNVDLFRQHLSPDAQKITCPHILDTAWPPSPAQPLPPKKDTSDTESDEKTTSTIIPIQEPASTTTPMEQDTPKTEEKRVQTEYEEKSTETNISLMETEPIPTKPRDTTKRDQQTQTQPTMQVKLFDVEKDKTENPYSQQNIDRNAQHDSDDEPPEDQQDSPVHHVVISTPPNSPDNCSNSLIFDTPGPIRNRLALRRRFRFQTSTPLRRQTNFDSSSDNDTSIDLLMTRL